MRPVYHSVIYHSVEIHCVYCQTSCRTSHPLGFPKALNFLEDKETLMPQGHLVGGFIKPNCERV